VHKENELPLHQICKKVPIIFCAISLERKNQKVDRLENHQRFDYLIMKNFDERLNT
jgi:hypothetical protein